MNAYLQPILDAAADTSDCKISKPIVLSTRIRLARNLAQHRFPNWADEAQRQTVFKLCQKAFQKLPQFKKSPLLTIDTLNENQKQILFERHLVSKELCDAKPGSGFIIDKKQSCFIMVNEEDHLRIQIMQNGFRLDRIWSQINTIDDQLEAELEYAFSSEIGYLTACPTNVGTGMRASVMLHLPGLVLSEYMEATVRAANQLGLAVRGLFGEGSEATGTMFQISNQQTLGDSESTILKRLEEILNTIIEHEKHARQKLLQERPDKILDKIARAYGILQNMRCLTSAEAIDLLSLMRLATDIGIFDDSIRGLIDRLILHVQPGHIQLFLTSENLTKSQCDTFRAKMLREAFLKIGPLDFERM